MAMSRPRRLCLLAPRHSRLERVPIRLADHARESRDGRRRDPRHQQRAFSGDQQQPWFVRRRHDDHHQDHQKYGREDGAGHKDLPGSESERGQRHGAAPGRSEDRQQSTRQGANGVLERSQSSGANEGRHVAADRSRGERLLIGRYTHAREDHHTRGQKHT